MLRGDEQEGGHSVRWEGSVGFEDLGVEKADEEDLDNILHNMRPTKLAYGMDCSFMSLSFNARKRSPSI